MGLTTLCTGWEEPPGEPKGRGWRVGRLFQAARTATGRNAKGGLDASLSQGARVAPAFEHRSPAESFVRVYAARIIGVDDQGYVLIEVPSANHDREFEEIVTKLGIRPCRFIHRAKPL